MQYQRVSFAFPFGQAADASDTTLVQLPTSHSTLGCSIRTDGQTLDFPNNHGTNSAGPNDTQSTVTDGVFMFIWTITGTATAGSALQPPTLNYGSNFKGLAAFSNNTIGGSGGLDAPVLQGSSVANTGSTTMSILGMFQVIGNVAGGSKLTLSTTGTNFPASVTAADVFIMECPNTWSIGPAAEEEDEKKLTPEQRKAKVAEMKEQLFMQLMAKQMGVTLPKELFGGDSDDEEDESGDIIMGSETQDSVLERKLTAHRLEIKEGKEVKKGLSDVGRAALHSLSLDEVLDADKRGVPMTDEAVLAEAVRLGKPVASQDVIMSPSKTKSKIKPDTAWLKVKV